MIDDGWIAVALSQVGEKVSSDRLLRALCSCGVDKNDVRIPFVRSETGQFIAAFEGYVFVRSSVPRNIFSRLNRLAAVESVLLGPGSVVADADVSRYMSDLAILQSPAIGPGDAMRVIAGPAEGLSGVVYYVDSSTLSVYALLDLGFLSRAVRISLVDVEAREGRPKLIVDGFELFFRSLHQGSPLDSARAVKGFVRWIDVLRREFHNHEIYVVWDSTSSWRSDVYSRYQLSRVEISNRETWDQVEAVRKLLTFLPVAQVTADHWEAVDVIAHLVDHFRGYRCVVVTSDKDLYQVVSDECCLCVPRFAMQPKYDFFTPGDVVRAIGLPPEKVSMYRAIRGGMGQHLPGAQIRSSSIITLCNTSRTLDEVFSSGARLLTEAENQRLQERREDIYRNWDLCNLRGSALRPDILMGSLNLVPLTEILRACGMRDYLSQLREFAQLFDTTGFLLGSSSLDDVDTHADVPTMCISVFETAGILGEPL